MADSVIRRTMGWELERFADLTGAFIFVRKPVATLIVDRFKLYLLEICDGQTVAATAQRVSHIMPAVNIDQCIALVNEQLRQLAAHDLISLEG
ncbi:hypothetical protein [Nonomuraea angiospora]|uniref:hypothetical protein n=1 Tax=Nonomuraea TaxID=83681 RepID=UPI00331F60FE